MRHNDANRLILISPLDVDLCGVTRHNEVWSKVSATRACKLSMNLVARQGFNRPCRQDRTATGPLGYRQNPGRHERTGMETAPTPRNSARTLRGMDQRELEIGFCLGGWWRHPGRLRGLSLNPDKRYEPHAQSTPPRTTPAGWYLARLRVDRYWSSGAAWSNAIHLVARSTDVAPFLREWRYDLRVGSVLSTEAVPMPGSPNKRPMTLGKPAKRGHPMLCMLPSVIRRSPDSDS